MVGPFSGHYTWATEALRAHSLTLSLGSRVDLEAPFLQLQYDS